MPNAITSTVHIIITITQCIISNSIITRDQYHHINSIHLLSLYQTPKPHLADLHQQKHNSNSLPPPHLSLIHI